VLIFDIIVSEIEDEGVHAVVCMMNNTDLVFITVKYNLYTILT
jgi:hypothetical protein